MKTRLGAVWIAAWLLIGCTSFISVRPVARNAMTGLDVRVTTLPGINHQHPARISADLLRKAMGSSGYFIESDLNAVVVPMSREFERLRPTERIWLKRSNASFHAFVQDGYLEVVRYDGATQTTQYRYALGAAQTPAEITTADPNRERRERTVTGPGGEKLKIAVLPVTLGKGADERLDPAIVDDAALTAVQNSGPFSVIGPEDMSAMLGFDKLKSQAGCDDTSCFAEIGGALGVDRLIAVTVGRMTTNWTVTCKLMNITATVPTVDARSVQRVAGDEDSLISALPRILDQLMHSGGL